MQPPLAHFVVELFFYNNNFFSIVISAFFTNSMGQLEAVAS